MQTLMVDNLDFNHNYSTFTLILPMNIVICGKFLWNASAPRSSSSFLSPGSAGIRRRSWGKIVFEKDDLRRFSGPVVGLWGPRV
jgi:hypothetical protein